MTTDIETIRAFVALNPLSAEKQAQMDAADAEYEAWYAAPQGSVVRPNTDTNWFYSYWPFRVWGWSHDEAFFLASHHGRSRHFAEMAEARVYGIGARDVLRGFVETWMGSNDPDSSEWADFAAAIASSWRTSAALDGMIGLLDASPCDPADSVALCQFVQTYLGAGGASSAKGQALSTAIYAAEKAGPRLEDLTRFTAAAGDTQQMAVVSHLIESRWQLGGAVTEVTGFSTW